MNMTSLRKLGIAWLFALTAVAISALAASFIYLRENYPTDPAYIATRTEKAAATLAFDYKGARKANYSDQEITDYLAEASRAQFDREWSRVLSIVASLYLVLSFGVV